MQRPKEIFEKRIFNIRMITSRIYKKESQVNSKKKRY